MCCLYFFSNITLLCFSYDNTCTINAFTTLLLLMLYNNNNCYFSTTSTAAAATTTKYCLSCLTTLLVLQIRLLLPYPLTLSSCRRETTPLEWRRGH